MAEKTEVTKIESPSGELILSLQNRINALEAQLQASETDRKGKSFVEISALDSRTAELRAEIAELGKEKKQVVKEEKAAVKGEKTDDTDGNDQEGFGLGLAELDALH